MQNILQNGKDYGGKADGLRTGHITVPHGKATMKSSLGTLNCQFEHGSLTGPGKLILSDDTVYEGEFEYESFHGQGKLTLSNGNVYEGQWEKGILLTKPIKN